MLGLRQLCSSLGRRYLHEGRQASVSRGAWRPAVFTILVGGVSYSVSGVYAAELKLSRHYHMQYNDDLLSKVKRWWVSIGSVNRFSISVISLNTLVFLLWRVRPLHTVMEKYFLSSITNKSSLPLLLSSFSHTEVWHLGLNMLVLWSFTPALMNSLGDTDSSFHSWPYYITGGVFASMVGYYSQLARGLALGSLGASGALMAVVAMVVFNNPDATVYIILLPFIPIPASWALGGVVAMDMLGVIRGWQFFDHAGHLGGVLFATDHNWSLDSRISVIQAFSSSSQLYQWWLHKVCNNVQFKTARTWFKFRSRSRA